MSIQSDIEMLSIRAMEAYASKNHISGDKAIDIFRRRSQYDAMTAELERADWDMEVDDRVFTEFCEKESVTHILRCIKELDERYTDVLRLYYLQENTTREIAKLLSLNVKTVETRLSRGRSLLYKKLKECGMD